jgi:hypothetical protein
LYRVFSKYLYAGSVPFVIKKSLLIDLKNALTYCLSVAEIDGKEINGAYDLMYSSKKTSGTRSISKSSSISYGVS